MEDGMTARGSLSTRPSRWKHETLTRSSTADDIAAVDRNVKSRTTSGSGTPAGSVRIFPETLDFSWADFSSPSPLRTTPQTSPEVTPNSSPFHSPRPTPLAGVSSAVSTPFSSPSPLFVHQQPQAIAAASPMFFWGSPYLGPSSLSVPHLQTPRTIMPQTPSTIFAARGPSQLRQSSRPTCDQYELQRQSPRPNCDQYDLHQLCLEGGVTAAEVEGLWGVHGPF